MDSTTPSEPTANLATRPMRVLWAPDHNAGTWYPIVPVVDALGRAGHQVVVSGPPMVRSIAVAMGLPWRPDDMTLAGTAFDGRPTGFEDALRRRVQFARASFGALRPLLVGGLFDLVLADPFHYGPGLAAREAHVPWVSYVHHCFSGDELMDGLFEMSWAEWDRRGDIVTEYQAWWADLRSQLGLGPESRTATEAWAYAVSPTLSLILGPSALPPERMPPGSVAIGATPWDPPGSVPAGIRERLRRRPLVLAAASSGQSDFPVAALAEAARAIQVGMIITGVDLSAVPGPPVYVTLAENLPHSQLLPFVSAVVCAGGWGLTTKSLAAGMPVGVLPHGLDTANVASAVVAHSCGVWIRPSAATPAHLAAAIMTLLRDPAIRGGAVAMAESDAPVGAAGRAVAAIEAVLQ
ncbi:MAG: glycosyltransferase [Candidatus Dormibacteria bacterium]